MYENAKCLSCEATRFDSLVALLRLGWVLKSPAGSSNWKWQCRDCAQKEKSAANTSSAANSEDDKETI